MSKQHKNNSIIFLTTLSVYLGLVLVGGAMSPVLAQAATTRNFNVQDEIEVKDDLDEKPDKDDLFVSSVIRLVEELDKLSKKGNFSWQSKNEFRIESFAFCESDNLPSFEGSSSINQQFDNEIEQTAVEISRRLLEKISKLKIGSKYDRIIDYKFSTENKSLIIQAKVKFADEKSTQIFAKELASYLVQNASISKPTKEKVVAENTKITVENNQVFIVTRLPRGSLDELLKQNAKAEIR